jgi:hypothetical protein
MLSGRWSPTLGVTKGGTTMMKKSMLIASLIAATFTTAPQATTKLSETKTDATLLPYYQCRAYLTMCQREHIDRACHTWRKGCLRSF